MTKVIYEENRSPEWYTPGWLRVLTTQVLAPHAHCASGEARKHAITIDPATISSNPLNAAIARTLATAEGAPPDGHAWARALLTDHGGPGGCVTLWLNPPYGRGIGDWLAAIEVCRVKLHERASQLASLALVPARPGAAWYALECERADVVCELRGRVTFEADSTAGIVASKDPARWGSTLLYTGPDRVQVARALREHGRTTIARARPRYPRSGRPGAAGREDGRQLPLAWAPNVVPLEPRQGRARKRARK